MITSRPLFFNQLYFFNTLFYTLFFFLAKVRWHLAGLGCRSLDEAIGLGASLLKPKANARPFKTTAITTDFLTDLPTQDRNGGLLVVVFSSFFAIFFQLNTNQSLPFFLSYTRSSSELHFYLLYASVVLMYCTLVPCANFQHLGVVFTAPSVQAVKAKPPRPHSEGVHFDERAGFLAKEVSVHVALHSLEGTCHPISIRLLSCTSSILNFYPFFLKLLPALYLYFLFYE